jgi:hypothetical protein
MHVFATSFLAFYLAHLLVAENALIVFSADHHKAGKHHTAATKLKISLTKHQRSLAGTIPPPTVLEGET